MAPRVLIVAPELDVGGTEDPSLPALCRGSGTRGSTCSIFAIARGGQLESEFAQQACRLRG